MDNQESTKNNLIPFAQIPGADLDTLSQFLRKLTDVLIEHYHDGDHIPDQVPEDWTHMVRIPTRAYKYGQIVYEHDEKQLMPPNELLYKFFGISRERNFALKLSGLKEVNGDKPGIVIPDDDISDLGMNLSELFLGSRFLQKARPILKIYKRNGSTVEMPIDVVFVPRGWKGVDRACQTSAMGKIYRENDGYVLSIDFKEQSSEPTKYDFGKLFES